MRAARHILMDMYVGQFAARDDAHVRDSRWHKNEPLTPSLADQALREGFSLSAYTAVKRNGMMMTHVGAIDFDDERGLEQAKAVRSFLGSKDIDALLVGSRRGAHLWVQTIGDGKHGSEPFGMVPASVMRRALTSAVHLVLELPTKFYDPDGPDPDESWIDEKCEVFPKKSMSDFGAGALRIPLMQHPKSGVRYPAYDPFDDREVTEPLALVNLMADIVTPYDALYRLAGPETAQPSYPRFDAAYSRPSLGSEDAPRVTDLLGSLGVQGNPGRSVRCPFHEDRKASLQIAPDDMRAWCKAPSCDLYNDGRGLGSVELRSYMRKENPSA